VGRLAFHSERQSAFSAKVGGREARGQGYGFTFGMHGYGTGEGAGVVLMTIYVVLAKQWVLCMASPRSPSRQKPMRGCMASKE
jgi:hypothetical protein